MANEFVDNSLKVWRAKKDITQKDLADVIGVSRQTINAIEKKNYLPSILIALKITKYFETTVEEVFFISEMQV